MAERLVLDLRGFYPKTAQLLALLDDFIPPQYMEFCKRMQDRVPSGRIPEAALESDALYDPEFAPGEPREIVERSLGKSIEDVFTYFEDEPLGAASIGQVHRATMKDGTKVVVKVMYPKGEYLFRWDMRSIKKFCALAEPQHLPYLDEMEKQFESEFDYTKEAENLQKVGDNMNKRWGKYVRVPKPIRELCTPEILVMEVGKGASKALRAGVKLIDGIREQYGKIAASMGRTLEELELEQKEKIARGEVKEMSIGVGKGEDEGIHEPIKAEGKGLYGVMPAANAWRSSMRNAAIRGLDCMKNLGRLVYNVSVLRLLFGHAEYKYTEIPINLGRVLELLMVVHGEQVLLDGLFNGDPHPGNIMLMPDGRLGLIDFGQTKALAREDRVMLAKLFIALNRDDREEVARIMVEEMGFTTKKMDPDAIWRYAAFNNDRYTNDVMKNMNIQQFTEWLDKTDPITHLNDEHVLVGRVTHLLRGVATAFQLKIRCSEYWEPIAQRVLAEGA
eukprot:gene8077-9593_t